jgi:hypothetical protein
LILKFLSFAFLNCYGINDITSSCTRITNIFSIELPTAEVCDISTALNTGCHAFLQQGKNIETSVATAAK